MIPDYELTADNIRSFWAEFGPVDIAWNINSNGEPSTTAKGAGDELGCKVLKNKGVKAYLPSLLTVYLGKSSYRKHAAFIDSLAAPFGFMPYLS
ncbi:hypothetical protein ACN5YO_001942 [Vibrio parahaemolyticus]|nr:hypothetical protein [Vibrio parahaemolyticus]MBE4481561.1 hypothetical protein [Vibrio parahaemolyticus]MBE5135291.1 hypothetical protein [Vibrio parahaemolyticus]MCF9076944.1 hypothetical protein [Vibrio parahaemolyticus]HCM1323853.1 hypothetical protein [Vibrio parahaemolyticus]